jgi:multisubunit Na+/H+ antiporter MnhE subunit
MTGDPDERADEREVAAEYLTARLEPRRLNPLRVLWVAVLAAGGAGDGDDVGTYDLVVARIDTGREVIRTRADVGDPRIVLGQVELDLETKTVAEFLAEWRA